MARRKGSGRGKTTVNARKSALENARERLKDDPGGTTQSRLTQQQTQDLSNSNMDAATTTTTTKHYNKTAKLQNNHQRSTERRGTYRNQSGESQASAHTNAGDNVKVQKQTAKQAKAAAQRAAAMAAYTATLERGGNKATGGSAKDPLAINSDAAPVLSSGGSGGGGSKAARTKEAREQKTVAKSETAVAGRGEIATATTANASTTSATSSNNKHSDNSNSNLSKNNFSLSQSEMTRKSEKLMQQEEAGISDNNNGDIKVASSTAAVAVAAKSKTVDTAATTTASTAPTAVPSAASNTWNNSRYLHKKFKRLASTTDVDSLVADSQSAIVAGSSASSDAGSEAPQTRTTSLSSSASTSSISPPPATTPTSMPTPTAMVTATTTTTTMPQPNAPGSSVHSVISTALTNGHIHAGAVVTTIEQLNSSNNNNMTSVKPNVAAPNSNSKSENSNNNGPLSLTNDGGGVLPQRQQTVQQHLEAEQLPQTMLHFFENQQSQPNNSGNNSSASTSSTNSGRYVCPYCNLNCTKPSVLQKHIRAHTNERPYPCDICGIAFKTNSNYYKHCRSRSHAARKRGIEVPIGADDGLFGGSDQEGDPELSNSSSDVISRTASPLDELSSTSSPAVVGASTSATASNLSPQQLQQVQQQQQQHKQTQLQQQQQLALAMQQQQTATTQPPYVALLPTPSPSSISSAKSAYLQQPIPQQSHQLPLGSPAAGTLPPPTTSNATNITTIVNATPKQVGNAEHKPYKPKFHNAALYATTKEAAAAAAAAAAAGIPPGLLQPLPLQQLPQTPQHSMPPAAHLAMLPHTQAPPPLPPVSHHPSLSPSTQVKLNNHISTHQLQLQMQHQQQQQQPLHVLPPLNAGIQLHHVAAMSPKSAAQRPDMVNAAAVAAANMNYLATPRMIYPGAIDFPPEALHMMMPESRQKLHYQVQQYKWLEQELQQHLHKLSQQQQPQLQHLQSQPQSQPQPQPHAQPTILKPTATMPIHARAASSSGGNSQHASAAGMQQMAAATAASNLTLQSVQQTPLQYLANTAAGQQSTIGGSSASSVSSTTSNTTAALSSGLLHSNISNAAASGANKVADLVQEHISKLISQNEAIVENKAVLLQKKYPKGLNRSRSFNNNNNNNGSGNINSSAATSTNTAGGSISLVTTPAVANESATNARLAQAIVQKQQQQQLQQQLQQQQHYQQQFQQQLLAGTQAIQMPPPSQQQPQQQHLTQIRLEEQHQQPQFQQQQHVQPNGISKHLTTAAAPKPGPLTGSTPQQQLPAMHPQHQQQQPSTNVYRQQNVSGQAGFPSQEAQRPMSSPTTAQNVVSSHKEIMNAMQQMSALPTANSSINASANSIPLNLSAKPRVRQEEPTDVIPSSSSTSTSSSTPHKRQSIENPISTSSNDGSTSGSMVGASATTGSGVSNAKQPTNVSIIKNLLLNARGLAVPTGEGEDAVYNCPLCSSAFRTAEDLQLHNSTYCQGASSAPISPVSSPSYRYFRSNSITLNLPELKNSLFRSRDPLPLAKLAWYQLRTKPSSLVLSRLSASQAGSSKATTTTTTSATSTAPTSSTSSNSIASCVASPRSTPPTAPPATLSLPDPNIVRLIDAPLPSPGPLLGKTPLVDFGNTSESRKSEDVIITKMHEDRQFDAHTPAKRAKMAMDNGEPFVLAPAPANSGGLMAATSSKRMNINSISGGDMQLLSNTSTTDLSIANKRDERMRRFTSSGGCIIPISECSDMDKSPKMIRTPLLSGGSFQEVSPKPKEKENKNAVSLPFANSSTFAPKLGLPVLGLPTNGPQHFQFPINPITAFNPLTLPPLHGMPGGGEKIIPHVPGIPGPNSLTPQLPPPQHLQLPQSSQMLPGGRSLSPNRKKTQSPMLISSSVSPKSLALPSHENLKSLSPFGGVQNVPSEFERAPPPPGMRNARNWNQNVASGSSSKPGGSNSLDVPKKTFNFTRMADNISPRKGGSTNVPKSSPPENEVRHFNFDHLSKDGESNRAPASSALTPLHVDITASAAGPTPNSSGSELTDVETKKTKFLRPTSLPLKPGTFTPKRHHGITPTANTLPLISPETPRPSKSCVQLYLNGHAYTYLGLKCSTKMFYCTVNCPQPSYVAGSQKLSMYSVWQVCAENNPHPLGFKPKVVMSLYDSRQKTSANTMAGMNKLPYALVVSQQTVMTPFDNHPGQYQHHQMKQISLNTNTSECGEQSKKTSAGSSGSSSGSSGSVEGGVKKESSAGQMLVGGYESHEDYTYIRGRGRGRYVCSECGIRCKKPSMLKKHIRTHTDVRPYTCKHCNFSFKTKGNLTKHMQSKTHFKKCLELGINPGPMPADGEFLEPEPEFDQQSTTSAGGRTSSIPGESDSEDYSDNESESSDTDESKSRLLEHEAARGLLSLSMTPPIGQSISPRPKSEPYPYQHNERVDPSAISFAGQMSAAATTATSLSTSNTHPTGIKRVISFSSPKPPFDYQKQEQYYSNPEESKPKHSNNAAAAIYESAPIDLTKPRAVVNPTPSPVTTSISVAPRLTVDEYNTSAVVPLPDPPVQTQAQIRDVIFGSSNNESGFLKTLISVSDKVRSSTEMLENYKNGDELSQAYQYHKAFQYHKIKQIQMNRSFPDAINVSAINQNLASTPTLSTVSVTNAGPSTALTTTSNANSGLRISDNIATTTAMASSSNVNHATSSVDSIGASSANKMALNSIINVTNVDKREKREKSAAELQVPAIEVSVVLTDEAKNEQPANATTAPGNSKANAQRNAGKNKTASIKSSTILSCKSSDEEEDSECISDQEQSAVGHTSKGSRNVSNTAAVATTEPHNAKLPAVVAQPGTTDFTGVLSAPGRTVVVGEDGLKKSGNNEIQPVYPRVRMSPDGRPVCKVCAKTFQTQGQLSLHMNIHYMERKFRCEPCGVSFRTQGHLQKHERAEAHKNKVMMTSTFGVPTTSNPRPFECTDCKIAFRIHGHLAKHLRSKTHVQKLECLQKLPFGTYAEIERAGISLTEIDTSDCENSLISLKTLAQKLIEKDPNKLGSYTNPSGMGGINSSSGGGNGGGGGGGGVGSVVNETTNTNTNHSAIVSQDSASEDDFSAATIAAATAIASLDNDSAANTPKRANSTSEDEAIASGLSNNLKRRLPGNFSNGEESDNPTEGGGSEKRTRVSSLSSVGAASATAAVGSPASITSSNASSNN